MTLIDGDRTITAQLYDDEHEEFIENKMSIIDYINAYTDEGVTEADVVEKTSWIPVSERLPEKSGKYWCTFGGTNLTGSDYYTTESDAKKLFDDSEEYAGWRSQNVIAWMPLPKSYKAESEG